MELITQGVYPECIEKQTSDWVFQEGLVHLVSSNTYPPIKEIS